MKFKDKLRQLRKEAGVTQEELAHRAGMPVHSVRNHEQGQRQPSWPAVIKLARALGVSTEEFASCDSEEEQETEAKRSAKRKRVPGKRKPGS
jgi:DNA-binding XRE family transcriptional regulator